VALKHDAISILLSIGGYYIVIKGGETTIYWFEHVLQYSLSKCKRATMLPPSHYFVTSGSQPQKRKSYGISLIRKLEMREEMA
jgi:hypothetical protein